MSIRKRSNALAFKFFSLKINAPAAKEMITLPRRIIDIIAMSASSDESAEKYAKSAIDMKIDIIGIHQFQWNFSSFFEDFFIMSSTVPIIAT